MNRRLPEDFPHDELEQRIADDAQLKRLIAFQDKAEVAHQRHVDELETKLEAVRTKHDSSEPAMRARLTFETAAARVSNRIKEITNKLKREYWTGKDRAAAQALRTPAQVKAGQRLYAFRIARREAEKAQKNTTPPPPNEVIEGHQNGSLESSPLDGARDANPDNQMPQP